MTSSARPEPMPRHEEHNLDYGDLKYDKIFPLADIKDWCRKYRFQIKKHMDRKELLRMLNSAGLHELFRLGMHRASKNLQEFLRKGCVIIPNGIPREDVERMCAMAVKKHAEMNAELLRYNGANCVEELTKKSRLKFQEMAIWNTTNLHHRDIVFEENTTKQGDTLLPKFPSAAVNALLEELSGLWQGKAAGDSVGKDDGPFEIRRCGLLMACPGTVDQHLHRDIPLSRENTVESIAQASWSTPSQIQVMIPLTKVTRDNGATQFFPYTQLPWVHITDASPTYFVADPGDVIVMDPRCAHRGSANYTTEERPVAYFVYMRRNDNGLNEDGTPIDDNYNRDDWPSIFEEPPVPATPAQRQRGAAPGESKRKDSAKAGRAARPPAEAAKARGGLGSDSDEEGGRTRPEKKRRLLEEDSDEDEAPMKAACAALDSDSDPENNRTVSKSKRRILVDE